MKESYYQRNKHEWRKGGKYYKYIPKADRAVKIPVVIKKGKFIISFD